MKMNTVNLHRNRHLLFEDYERIKTKMSTDIKSVKECIFSRHSTRNYAPDVSVPEDKLHEILNAGLQAPSPKNSQPWFYYIIEEREKIVEVSEIMKKTITEMIAQEENLEVPKNKLTSALETAQIISSASVLLIVCYEKKNSLNNSEGAFVKDMSFSESEMVDCISIGASVQNMLLMAESLGIDSLWVADILFAQEEVSKYLKIKHRMISAVLLGKAAKSLRYRKSIAEKVKWI